MPDAVTIRVMTKRNHDAFICYSHDADAGLSGLLEKCLERLARPTFKLRAMDVFRDQTSLEASPALWEVIALHHGGSGSTPRLRGDGNYEANEGIALPAIRRSLGA